MPATSSHPEPDTPSTLVQRRMPAPVELDSSLISKLADEMIRRWEAGEHLQAEDLLNRHPELWHKPEMAVELVYEEICLRKDHGEIDYAEPVLQRFPQWRRRLEVMVDCHRLLEASEPLFPEAGETLAGYRLLERLGSGASGRVFLAQQSDLGDRPVVLKITALEGHEHINLARLQHTHIVPLYAVHNDPIRNLRILCMPYFGGVTLDALLQALAGCPLEQRSGGRLLQALQVSGVQSCGPAQPILGRFSYVQALCWIAACLAEALHYAQESGMVHLDVKPSNILIAADGQPMLLDFHLAREPIRPDGPQPDGIGGTAPYMAPEQREALTALSRAEPLPRTIDRRADIFALGAVLYEALGGTLNADAACLPPLLGINHQVSRGLSDIVARCLACRAEDRYADAAALATDLRCHLADLPLQGIANRSWLERFRKWRRRQPTALPTTLLLLVVLGVLALLVYGSWSHWRHLSGDVKFALEDGHKNWHDKGRFAEAVEQLKQGLMLARSLPFQGERVARLEEEIRLAERAQAEEQRQQTVRDLHALAEQVRALFDFDNIPTNKLAALRQSCQEFWNKRQQIQQWLESARSSEAAADLLDLLLLASDLQIRLARAPHQEAARRQALKDLDEAEDMLGPSVVLDQERNRHRQALNLPLQQSATVPAPQTMWEHLRLGRSALLAGDSAAAAPHLQKAVEFQPYGFWPNFYQGQCAYRQGNYAEAAAAFSVCIGAAPTIVGPYFNRALAFVGLEQPELALRDYDRVLRLEPTLASAALNRGLLQLQAKRYCEAETDLQRAIHLGADEVPATYNLALARQASGNTPAALQSLDRVLFLAPEHRDALALRERLLGKR